MRASIIGRVLCPQSSVVRRQSSVLRLQFSEPVRDLIRSTTEDTEATLSEILLTPSIPPSFSPKEMD